MYSYGTASTHIGGREGVPVPKVAAAATGFAGWTVCHCGLKHRPGAYHLCIDLGTPEPIVAPKPKKAAPKKKAISSPKPPAARKTGECACGKAISREATFCQPCEGKRRKEAGILPKYVGPIGARIEEVARRYEAGEAVQQIANDIGVTQSGVRIALKRHGVTMRPPVRSGTEGKRVLTAEQHVEAARLYESGLSLDAVALHFKVSQHAIINALGRLGVQRRSRGGNQGRAA